MTTREAPGWKDLVTGAAARPFAIALGGILLQATSALLTATVLPSAVAEIGGTRLVSWPTAAFLAASIAAASSTGLMSAALGRRRTYIAAALIFAGGAAICGTAPSMAVIVAGRLVQGLGGGFLAALAYVMIRVLYPPALWPRAFSLISGMWGMAVLLGPLIGGIFAGAGLWRGAFLATAALAALLGLLAATILPRDGAARDAAPPLPALRLALLLLAIVTTSAATILSDIGPRAALLVAAPLSLVMMLRLDRRAAAPLLPSDAFSPGTVVGAGLWMILLLSISNDPFPIYGPLFLQRLHGLSPLWAGFLIAAEALSWTVTSIAIAGLAPRRVPYVLVGAPLAMALGLAGIGVALPAAPITALFLPIYLSGGGIGAAWAFIAQGIMSGARPREEDRAAASVATVQQIGLALGAALAGLAASLAGLSETSDAATMQSAAFWVPTGFALTAAAASVMGLRMSRLQRARR